MQERPHGADRARPRPYVVWLIGAGALATVIGVVWVLIAFESAQQATTFSGPIPTLPVFTYAQYSQRDIVPDYTGLLFGLIVAGNGALVLLAGSIVAFARRRTA